MMTTSKTRAPKGGAYGANGEWYDGGKFINTVAHNPKGLKKSPPPTRKMEIEPYVWVKQPSPDMLPLMGYGCGVWWTIRKDGTAIACDPQIAAYYHVSQDEVQRIINQWNEGMRWRRKDENGKWIGVHI